MPPKKAAHDENMRSDLKHVLSLASTMALQDISRNSTVHMKLYTDTVILSTQKSLQVIREAIFNLLSSTLHQVT